jgi:hypothetical protein
MKKIGPLVLQEKITIALETTTLLKDLNLIDLVELDSIKIINVDSKNNKLPFRNIRINLKEKFIKNNGAMPRINITSAIRGDVLIQTDSYILICDIKNYSKNTTMFKFPKHIINELNDFVKGADSNVKYTSFYITKNINEDFGKLHNYLFSKSKDDFLYLKNKYKDAKKICEIDKDIVIKIFSFVELGFCYDMYNVSTKKLFITKNNDKLESKYVDFKESLYNDTPIDIELIVEDDYIHLFFLQNGEIFYTISHRGNGGNCSFIHKKHLKNLGEVNCSDYQIQIP